MSLEVVIAFAVFISAVVLLTFAGDKADDFSIRTSSFFGGTLKVKRKEMYKATRWIVELFSLVVYF